MICECPIFGARGWSPFVVEFSLFEVSYFVIFRKYVIIGRGGWLVMFWSVCLMCGKGIVSVSGMRWRRVGGAEIARGARPGQRQTTLARDAADASPSSSVRNVLPVNWSF